ncbi:MAG: hypothetical protein ACLU4N_11800 [Butyricimonas faecihominis]
MYNRFAGAKLLPHADALKDVNGEAITSKQIASRGTAHAILAHLYAWKATLNKEPELNQLAIAECDTVLSYKYYQLAGNIHEVCETVMLGNSDEGIFELDYRITISISDIPVHARFCQRFQRSLYRRPNEESKNK